MANSLIFRNVTKVPTLQDAARYNKYNITNRTTYSYYVDRSKDPYTDIWNSIFGKYDNNVIYLYNILDLTSNPGYIVLTGLKTITFANLIRSETKFTGFYYVNNNRPSGGPGSTGPFQITQAGICQVCEWTYSGASSSNGGITGLGYYCGISISTTPSAGTFVDTIIAPTTYPTNGQYNGYWYIKQ